jgi:DNA end-binding protein Ku
MKAIWTGALSLGLVNIPIKLYSGVRENSLDFTLLHKEDFSPIRYARFCKQEEKEVDYNSIVRGYEYEKGRYVILDDSDFDRANMPPSPPH